MTTVICFLGMLAAVSETKRENGRPTGWGWFLAAMIAVCSISKGLESDRVDELVVSSQQLLVELAKRADTEVSALGRSVNVVANADSMRGMADAVLRRQLKKIESKISGAPFETWERLVAGRIFIPMLLPGDFEASVLSAFDKTRREVGRPVPFFLEQLRLNLEEKLAFRHFAAINSLVDAPNPGLSRYAERINTIKETVAQLQGEIAKVNERLAGLTEQLLEVAKEVPRTVGDLECLRELNRQINLARDELAVLRLEALD